MTISTPLFETDLVRLGPIDHEKDAEIETRWTHDPSFMRMMYTDPMRPLSVFQIKKKYEALEKKIGESNDLFHFRIRQTLDDRLLGFGEIRNIIWTSGCGQIHLGIGSPEDWHKGFGSSALGLLVRYAFLELNLYRLTAIIPEYNQPARNLFTKTGFVEEVRRRQALTRDGRRWDECQYGLLTNEWNSRDMEKPHA